MMTRFCHSLRNADWPSGSQLLLAVALGLICLVPAAHAVLAHVEVTVSGTNFTYNVFNDEAQGSSLLLSAFDLQLDAPLQAVQSPPGWTYETDGSSYVHWTSTSDTPPFTNDIPPGASLSGFVVQAFISTTNTFPCSIVSSDLSVTNPGTAFTSAVVAPSATTYTPGLDLSPNAGFFQLSLTGVPGFLYTIESSTNLTDWLAVTTNTPPFVLPVLTTNAVPSMMFRAEFQATQD